MNIEVSKLEFEKIKNTPGVISFMDIRGQDYAVYGEVVFIRKLKQSEAEAVGGEETHS